MNLLLTLCFLPFESNRIVWKIRSNGVRLAQLTLDLIKAMIALNVVTDRFFSANESNSGLLVTPVVTSINERA